MDDEQFEKLFSSNVGKRFFENLLKDMKLPSPLELPEGKVFYAGDLPPMPFITNLDRAARKDIMTVQELGPPVVAEYKNVVCGNNGKLDIKILLGEEKDG